MYSGREKFKEIIPVDHLGMVLGVSSGKGLGEGGFGFRVPFHFIGPEVAFPFFDIVDLLLVLCTPEEGIGVYIPVVEPFFSFADEPVFPKRASVLADLQRLILGDERIPDTVVVEIDLAFGLQFLAQVPAERREPKNDKSLFEQGDVVFHCLVVQISDLPQFMKGNLIAQLKGERLEQSGQFIGFFDAFPHEDVFVKKTIGQLIQNISFLPWVIDYFGVIAKDQTVGKAAGFFQKAPMGFHLSVG